MRKRLLLSLAVTLIALLMVTSTAGPVRAQVRPSQADVTSAVDQLLRSTDQKEVAWGAHTASQYRVVSAIPLLTAVLERVPGGDSPEARALELAILDALVQMGAHVPAGVLRASLERWPVPTLILLGNATGDRDGVLLDRFGATGGFEWQAIANLLFERRPDGFASRLLEKLPLRLEIHVIDNPGRGIGPGSGGGTSRDSNYLASVPGFPPLAHYTFVLPAAGATILSIGPRTVYYTRLVRNPPGLQPQGSTSEKASDSDRILYANAIVTDRFEAGPLRETTFASAKWAGQEALQQEVDEQRASLNDAFRNVVSVLVTRRLLTQEESRALSPVIATRILDDRDDKSTPLPPIADAEAVRVRPRPGPIRKVHDVRPTWPEAAQRADVRGSVLVGFTIAPDGSVTDVRIVRGIPLLNEAALECVRQWRYDPVLFDGRPIPMPTTAAVSFP